jgi:hypothetical protein
MLVLYIEAEPVFLNGSPVYTLAIEHDGSTLPFLAVGSIAWKLKILGSIYSI